jgi:predicted  nucleic acid-binding Zn-ribbon protein
MRYSQNNRSSCNKALLASALIIAGLVLVGALLYKNKARSDTGLNKDPVTEEPVNLSPPTKEENRAADQQKEKSEEQQKQTDTPRSGLKQVTPIITNAGQYDDPQYGNRVEVRSFVPGIYEEGRYCKVALTKGSSTIVKNVDAIKDATTTRCDVAAVPRSEFPSAGTWSVVVSYASPTAEGRSEIKQVEVK